MDDPRIPPIELDKEQLQRAAKKGCGCGILLLIGIFLLAGLGPYTDFLWYAHDVRHPEVISTAYGTQGTLFVIGFIASLLAFYFSLSTALRLNMVFFDRPVTIGQRIVTNAMGWVQDRGQVIVKLASVVIAFLSGSSLAGEWQTWLLS